LSSVAADPTVSVVITTYNRRDQIAGVLAPLLSDPDAQEVVVVVDGCHDGSFELLTALARDHSKLRPLMPERNLGQPKARLFGVERSHGDVVLSLDDDVTAAPGLVGGHRRHHARRPHAVVLGYMPTETPSRRQPGQFTTFEYARAYEDHCALYERDPAYVLTHLWGGNFSVRRADFLAAVAGYDFPLRYHEDRDLGLRFRRLGLEPVFDRTLRATHRHDRSFDAYLRDSRSAGTGARMLPVLHPDVLDPYSPDDALEHYSLPARILVSRSDVPWKRAASLAALRGMVGVAGRLHAFTLESKIAAVAKHIAERQGAREADITSGSRRSGGSCTSAAGAARGR
jgi:glycosyltransferase involved in cell wall biosynthesis